MKLDGILVPLCTPFAEDGGIHHAALRRNIAAYNRTGLLGYVAAGSTGEAVFLAREEKLALYRTVRESAGEDKLLIAGTAAESVRETREIVSEAAAMGYHAALVITPHYYRGQMQRAESQVAFYRAVADTSPLPVILYNIPQNTGIDLAVETVRELAGHPNIVAIKESSVDPAKAASLVRGVPGSFPVLVGSSARFHECLTLGATGGILAIANAFPDGVLRIYERYRAGDVAGSKEAQDAIVQAAGVAPRFGIQGLKYGMELRGYYGGPVRLPLLPLDAAQKEEIAALFLAAAAV